VAREIDVSVPPGMWFALLVTAASWGLLCTFVLIASYYTKEWVLPAWWLTVASAMSYGATVLCVMALV